MTLTLDFLPQSAFAFMLIFARIGAMAMTLPGIGDRTVPPRIRLVFALALSLILFPLVKTAFFAADPNWGRVVMAVGKAGEAADRDRLSIWFGDILVAEKGEVTVSYKEEDGADYMKSEEIHIKVDVGIDNGEATVWTCDFTHDYITINADYRS